MDSHDVKYLLASNAADFARWLRDRTNPEERDQICFWLEDCRPENVIAALGLLCETEVALYETIEAAKRF